MAQVPYARPPVTADSIPQEVVAAIFAELPKRDVALCASVCRTWATEANYSLYHTGYPRIHDHTGVEVFRQTLLETPERARQITGLSLRARLRNTEDWISLALVVLAPLLPNLRTLSIERWEPVSIQRSVLNTLDRFLGRVTKLELRSPKFYHPANLETVVLNLQSLSHLRLENVRYHSRVQDVRPLGNARSGQLSRLTTLELWGNIGDAGRRLYEWLECKGCRPAELVISRALQADVPHIEPYLRYVGNRLRVFKFSDLMMDPFASSYPNIDVSQNVEIASLTIGVYQPASELNGWAPWLLENAMNSSRRLRDVTFETTLDFASTLRKPVWLAIADLLARSRMETLTRVAFVHRPILDEAMFRPGPGGGVGLQNATEAFQQCFGHLERHGMTLEIRNAPVIDLGVRD